MQKYIKSFFQLEKKPTKGLLPVEWIAMVYLLITTILIFIFYTKLSDPQALIIGRFRIVAMTALLWLVYRIVPCRLTRLARVAAQLGLLAWWYPDTYEINRVLPNLDHIFAAWEQNWFGMQPALEFSKALSHPIFSELFDMGYAAYYPMIGLTVLYYFFAHYKSFERASFILLASFFIYYLIFIFVPVVGPTFYFKAVGIDTITSGVFPNVHNYFNLHQDCLPSPGYEDGIFYQFVESAKAAGERPTAAFPSSHVGISTICMLLIWRTKNRALFYILIPVYFFLCCATVYIQAHYLVDAIAGVVSALIIYFVLLLLTSRMELKR